jgi:CRISPR-associated exonuclease Cas4
MVSESKTKDNKNNVDNTRSDLPILSASDIERYCYCPLSWWLKYEGLEVSSEILEKGTEDHRKIIKNVSKIKEREGLSQRSEFNIKLFAFVAIILAINAIVILFPDPVFKDFLVYIGLIWLTLAIIFYFYSIFKGDIKSRNIFIQTLKRNIETSSSDINNQKTSRKSSIFETSPQTWRQSAIYFIIIAGGLAFNGLSLTQPAPPEIMSQIYLVSALLWLIGTSIILFFVLRSENENKKFTGQEELEKSKKIRFNLTKSEKLIIGFALVATLFAINGLTIQYQDTFSQSMLISQIIIGLAGLWLGVSFVFIYFSFQGGIVVRSFAKEFEDAGSETKKYNIIIERFATQTISRHIVSSNWPLLFTIVAIILGINSIILMYSSIVMGNQEEILSRFLIIIALLWLLGAFIFLYDVLKNSELSNEIRRLHGIYEGKIEYTDKMDKKSRLLYSKKYGLRGKPDYIVKINNKYIPVEVKTGKIPKGPHFSHIIQIAAYCLLIHDNYKIRPPFGIITYSKEQKHKINYDNKLEELVKEKIQDMRECIKKNEAHRNHKRVGKCSYCSRRKKCPEKLS